MPVSAHDYSLVFPSYGTKSRAKGGKMGEGRVWQTPTQFKVKF